ncbi:MAG: hypothetical protein R3C26_07205 [Calditrichia bacterium]
MVKSPGEPSGSLKKLLKAIVPLSPPLLTELIDSEICGTALRLYWKNCSATRHHRS